MAHRSRNLNHIVEEYERLLIQVALGAAGGHQRRAADSLGLCPSTLSDKMKRLGLRRPRRDSRELAESDALLRSGP